MPKPSLNDRRLAQSEGFYNAFEFWASLSGQTDGTLSDHANYYLTFLGYEGTLNDKFNAWLGDNAPIVGGTPMDNYRAVIGIGEVIELLVDVQGNDMVDISGEFLEVLA